MDLTNPQVLKPLLARHRVRADKSLGQHFLCSRKVVDAICLAAEPFQGILEIGPGPGVLTSPLSENCAKLIALELDPAMPAVLAESAPHANVRELDALKANLPEVLNELPMPRGIVSNLPYYITGQLLNVIAACRNHHCGAVLMMQKEVGERILAGPKHSARGSLSVFLQSQFSIHKVVEAPAGAFLPPPKVDSIVLKFETLPSQPTEAFFKLLRFGFAQPRKTLVNNLVGGYHVSRDVALQWILESGLTEKSRPQELSNAQWTYLAEIVSK